MIIMLLIICYSYYMKYHINYILIRVYLLCANV